MSAALRRLGLAVCAATALAGCAPRVPRPAEVPRPAVGGADEARAVLEQRAAQSRTLTATFEIEIRQSDGRSEKSRGAVVVARPDRLRLQIFTFGVMTAYDFTVAGERYHLRRPLEGVDVVGRFGDEGSRAGIDLGQDLRPLFLLAAPVADARVEDRGDRLRVTVIEPAGRREIEVAKRAGRIASESLFAGEERSIAIEYDDYRAVEGFDMPFSIRVRYPKKAIEVTIAVRAYTRNQPVDPKLFEF